MFGVDAIRGKPTALLRNFLRSPAVNPFAHYLRLDRAQHKLQARRQHNPLRPEEPLASIPQEFYYSVVKAETADMVANYNIHWFGCLNTKGLTAMQFTAISKARASVHLAGHFKHRGRIDGDDAGGAGPKTEQA